MNNSEKSNTLFQSSIFGIVLMIILSSGAVVKSIPLFDFYYNFYDLFFSPVLGTVLFFLFVFYRDRPKVILWTCLVFITTFTIYRYSSGRAFRYFPIVLMIFSILLWNDESNRKKSSILTLALIYLFAAIHKINPYYLSGVEFIKGSQFLGSIDDTFPNLLPYELPLSLKYLPSFTIILELILAFGVLIKPKLFSFFMLLFPVLLSALAPTAISVYFVLLPLVITINSQLFEFWTDKIQNIVKNEIVWGTFIFYMTDFAASGDYRKEIVAVYPFVILILLTHLLSFKKNYKISDDSLFSFSGLSYKIFIVPLILIFLFVFSFSFVPAPYGFSMFAGKQFQSNVYSMHIDNYSVCMNIKKNWRFSRATDSGLRFSGPNNCILYFPTISGLKFAFNRLCMNNNSIDVKIKDSHLSLIDNWSCNKS